MSLPLRHDWKMIFSDIDGNPIGDLFRFSKIKVIERFNLLGYWSLETGDALNVWGLLSDGAYKVNILRDSDVFASGFIRSISGEEEGDTKKIELSGVDELFYLASRVVYPSTDGNFAADDYDDRTGRAETIVKGYVLDHASSSAVMAARRWAALTNELDFGRGDIVSASGRFQNLLEFCTNIFSSGGGLGMRVLDDVFKVYAPRDLSDTVVLSGGLLNIAKQDYRFDYPKGNYIIAGGAGDLTARTFYYSDDATSISTYGRIEQFVDTKNDSGQESADTHLLEGIEQYNISVIPNTNDPEFQPYRDYWVGDTITTKIFDTSFQNIVRSGTVVIDCDKGIEDYSVALETLLPKNKNPFYTIKQREMINSRRISSQERN